MERHSRDTAIWTRHRLILLRYYLPNSCYQSPKRRPRPKKLPLFWGGAEGWARDGALPKPETPGR